QEKLDLIQKAGSYKNLEWEVIKPNAFHDWLNQRSEDFYELKPLGDEDGIFATYQNGVQTNRDVWVYDFNKEALAHRIEEMIAFYNSEVDRIAPEALKGGLKASERL